MNNFNSFRFQELLFVSYVLIMFLWARGETMKRPTFVGDAIELDSNDRVIGRYDDYILKPFYQPIYSVENQFKAVLTGYEALVRPYLGSVIIPPDKFFEMVDPQDALFVECLCVALHVRGFSKAGIKNNSSLFVNIDVANYSTVDEIEREFFYTFSQLSKYGLGRSNIVFEILETEVANPEILLQLCQLIKTNGYKFALDDFGTNHSNVERYMSVNPDIIKLDRSLFMTAMKRRETSILLKSLISAFQENGVKVLMEGLETEQEMSFASEMDVDMLQGFYLGKPERIITSFIEIVDMPQSYNNVTELSRIA